MGMRSFARTLGGIGLLLACAYVAQATPGSAYADLQRHLTQPDQSVDFAAAKIAIDRLIDPSIDVAAVQRELDRLTRAVAARTPAGLTPRARMDVLLSTLYTAGDWNDHRPFRYDLDDPMGRQRENKLLSTYLRTRKGNCVSMPTLVTIIGQRLGLVVTLATGPEHVMTKFADGHDWLNVEATSGGYKWDSSYERDLDIGALALENEIYLRPLAPREAVGVMASTLMEALAANRRADDLMVVADMVLAANPTDVVAIIQKANAYYLQLQQRYNSRYARPADIPPELQADYAMRSRANLEWFAKAEALGWHPPTAQNRSRYLQSIDQEKEKRGQL